MGEEEGRLFNKERFGREQLQPETESRFEKELFQGVALVLGTEVPSTSFVWDGGTSFSARSLMPDSLLMPLCRETQKGSVVWVPCRFGGVW